jgi:hypothetical protein
MSSWMKECSSWNHWFAASGLMGGLVELTAIRYSLGYLTASSIDFE